MMTIKKIGSSAYEIENSNFDFHIGYERDNEYWIIDVFTLAEKDNDKAYIESESFSDLHSAIQFCEDYK